MQETRSDGLSPERPNNGVESRRERDGAIGNEGREDVHARNPNVQAVGSGKPVHKLLSLGAFPPADNLI
jgi:hypothetical protein